MSKPSRSRLFPALCLAAVAAAPSAGGETGQAASAAAADRQLLWGDAHLHTSYSADAYLNGNFTADPATAYRYALGEPVIHPYHRARVQIGAPLDFLVVSDHAEFLGGIRTIHRDGVDTAGMGFGDRLIVWFAEQMFRYALRDGYGMDLFESMSATPADPRERAAHLLREGPTTLPGHEKIVADAWRDTALTADAYNQPGHFTALIGWEWTATPGGANLHRVIFTDGDADSAVQYLPFSRDDSPYPEDLWHWLERTSATTGATFVSVPHNSNLSKGYMFPLETLRGEPFTPDYLALRARWEPVVEATQFKGDSETHPRLSPNDPFADFERFGFYIQAEPTPYHPGEGDFVRSALRRGLQIAHGGAINPYRFGLIGSTDSHTGLTSAEEDNFQGEQPPNSLPGNKARAIAGKGSATGWDMSASGRAAVWATGNTRAAIVAAFRRREVYATTGPRIAVRVEGGWFDPAGAPGEARAATVPMGATLPAPYTGGVPGFRVIAMKDPRGANLDRIQVVKGWVDAGGESHERVYDAAWSTPRALDAQGSPMPVGDTVDRDRAAYSNTIGAPFLETLWRDPDFDPARRAFYYVRVLQIPTPRHSLYDQVALDGGAAGTGRWPATLQERAYTSPIWYSPAP